MPQIGRSKRPFPMRARCQACPEGWRDTGEWDEDAGRFKRISPERAHAQDCASAARDQVLATGGTQAQARLAYSSVEERVIREHDVPDSENLWLWHVRGEDNNGKWYHRGAYSHYRTDTGLDVIWDIDKGQDPYGKAGVIVAKLAQLGLAAAAYANTSFSGNGVHVRLCHDLVPSWLRMAFGRELLKACGYTPGNMPSLGQTESFPKQARAPYAGNMVGLPCSLPKMIDGATCLLDDSGKPVTDPGWTAWRLQQVQPATLAEIHAAARALGIDPENEPAPPPVARPGFKRAIRTRSGPVSFTTGASLLVDAIRNSISITQVLAENGRHSKGGDKYTCAIHHEPEDGNPSFHVFVSTQLGSAHERYQCFGDCAGSAVDTGDVVSLYGELRGLTRREAVQELAERCGLNPADYRGKATTVSAEGRPAPVSFEPDEDLSDAVRWALSQHPRREHVSASISRVLLEQGLPFGVVAGSMAEAARLNPGPNGWDLGDELAKVAQVKERLDAGRRQKGRNWIESNVGHSVFSALSNPVGALLGKSKREAGNDLHQFHRIYSGTKKSSMIRQAYGKLGTPKKRMPWEKDRRSDDEKAEHGVRKSLSRAANCGHFETTGYDDMSGEIVKASCLRCSTTFLCVPCARMKASRISEMIEGKAIWGESARWAQTKTFGVSVVTFPPGAGSAVQDLKDHVSRQRDCLKISFLGNDIYTGGVVVMFLSTDVAHARGIAGATGNFGQLYDIDLDVRSYETGNLSTVTQEFSDVFASAAIWFDRLCVTGQEEAMLAHAKFWRGRHRISRGSKKLPRIPSDKDIKGASEAPEADTYEGQVVKHSLIHKSTQYVLACGMEHPPTIDQAVFIASHDQLFADYHMEFMADRQAAFVGGGGGAAVSRPPG